jgi:2-polyprenyl-6-methoxyphenol hydroxylase-like FAD-dependent oxidoreductase
MTHPRVTDQGATGSTSPTPGSSDPRVLIVGAGPTGLVLALWLTKLGVPLRIIDKNSGPGLASRAMAVQARTLEFYRQLGFADDVVAHGIKVNTAHMRSAGEEIASFNIGDLGARVSPYPFVLSFPQDDHERLLTDRLAAAGTRVEWGTELLEFDHNSTRVRATLRADGAVESLDVSYLAGCDGAHSTVRQALALGFPGGTYDQIFYVADVDADDLPSTGDINFCLGPDTLCAIFPVRSTGMHRLIGIVPDAVANRPTITFDDVRSSIEQVAPLRATRVNWFSTYHVHHRVAEHFRKGRVFLAGDAGHVHSPAGGQGMNTGIGDAVNLSWKLAHTLQHRAAPSVLDSYEPERITFARSLVATTDTGFRAVTGRHLVGHVVRTLLVPHIAPFALGFSAVRAEAFRVVSQTSIHYRESALSAGRVGDIHGGDRLPWVADVDNFAPLSSLDWQLHVYGAARPALRAAATTLHLPLHEFAWSAAMEHTDLTRDAMYLVRPDGYVALADATQDANALSSFLTARAAPPPR